MGALLESLGPKGGTKKGGPHEKRFWEALQRALTEALLESASQKRLYALVGVFWKRFVIAS